MPSPDFNRICIGTAGWSLPAAQGSHFPEGASHLERYASVFRVAEINSTFHRSHRASTFARWVAAVPASFRFSAKLPKAITHKLRLVGAEQNVAQFLEEVSPLAEKLACLLVQLPPSLAYEAATARAFLEHLRSVTTVPLACEPRHASWFTPEADQTMRELDVARVAADPAKAPTGAEPGGSSHLRYFRLHGSPRVYYSAYSSDFLGSLAERLLMAAIESEQVWCIFDNTTLGEATANALELLEKLQGGRESN